MVFIAIFALIAGVVCGRFVFTEEICTWLASYSDYVLYLLMFLVGISVGLNRAVFKKIREYHIKILLIPAGIVIGTILGGLVCSLLLSEKTEDSLAVVSGLGWYSLSGVLVTGMINARLGSIAFLSNLIREIMSFMIIPWVARHFNHWAAIAPAAATSEDTTLPVIMKSTSEEVTVMAVFNGVICSVLVPILTNGMYELVKTLGL
ncbi:MAG TPA: lysine exporter LysO family protein [Candidatus Scybalocola faecigallinarum]|uniref:Lysine exporter LysO family protein n=1 Tax=Candidatus Scybalocola faecigallinarum TaxID=2840941 RepID=A0A9D1JPR4_9FIRM|nr:lysine exporter LysO family protein [Candidatus Scybalocola faecigallinarum]